MTCFKSANLNKNTFEKIPDVWREGCVFIKEFSFVLRLEQLIFYFESWSAKYLG